MNIITMKQIEETLPNLGYAASFEKNLRASIRKCEKVYKTDLSRIPTDLAAFDRKWGRGRVRHIPKPFQTADQFRTWRKNTRMVIARVLAAPKPVAMSSEWASLLTFVEENQGKGQLLRPNSHLTFGVLARVASQANTLPNQITDVWVQQQTCHLNSAQRKSFLRGLGRFNAIIARRRCLPELEELLPTREINKPAPLRPQSNQWRRKANHPGAALIWNDFDEIIDLKRHGDDAPLEGAPVQFSANSAKSYEESLNWLLNGLAATDRLEENADLAEVINYANLVVATNHWVTARQERGQETKSSTLHNHVTRLVHLAVNYLEPSAKEVDRLIKLRKKPSIRTASVGKMSEARETWIKDFDRDVAKQARAHRLPEQLQHRAERTLSKSRAGQKVRPGEMMAALRAGVAALAAAMLFRASPLRATNLRTVRMRGEGAEFDVEDLGQDSRLRELRLSVPGEQVKNGAFIDEIADDDLAPIVVWYLKAIRPRLITDHPFNKPYTDSDYLFPSTSEQPMERSNFSEMFRRACIEVNFDMTMHQARHVTAYWILSMDPNAWDEAAALLGDDDLTVRKYYGWMNERRASKAGREKLQQARKGIRKHRKGEYDDAA
ncbi:tyrosine-type recombinase/integrase [Sulfitobacter sp. KE34]|uniref:tyrosine-type recombinase/integrase n=1 Tax=unclassified Sulfitobacter TaxID=196795 RepID=UPI0023E1077A|nr:MULTISPECIES: tyrosine-type recombinase/integrase [unclassified Sulfitobacter]MDF3351920.1 tyrosine-type recombinase/integrase [Sulfitobacter sp. KE12]MDF3355591.1 tyrosine-type recombinase/integrase [Sulfitobacter sp. KE27]MDF3359282.1 tyrosine-type recombinase/integrase [Sulfitobacter sp. KE33]MDF3366706.1 tyrosine-type recombinase/integrase [Sulfitobacter sp. Ks34]MDF3370272.1 tyrosine-type recombinase/integrase [Sulfitobacter sp. Ks43]